MGSAFPATMNPLIVPLAQLDDFDEIVDARTPLEFAEDHVPGAINAPVLSNEERVIIGTMYKQVSPFEATRVGAAMVARNIAQLLDTTLADRPRNWRPLVYCARGGKRSGALVAWFNLIGWRARQLDGGYKTYRRGVVEALDSLPRQFRYTVLTGYTGSGKTRLLAALAGVGAQTVDLEALAAHRGSVLGTLPGEPQPSQKAFDTALIAALRGLDRHRPVFIEAESRRIGAIAMPAALSEAMARSVCVKVAASHDDRIRLLLDEYGHLFETADGFKSQLARLVELHGRAKIGAWQQRVDANERAELFRELIDQHYDPAYRRSTGKHFAQHDRALEFAFRPVDDDLQAQARALLARLESTP